MNGFRALALVAAILFPGVALAQTSGGEPDRVDPAALQYMQSCGMGPLIGITTSGNAGDGKTIQSAYNPVWDGDARLFRYGEQWAVRANADGAVLVCQHHTPTATVSLGLSSLGGDGLGATVVDYQTTPAGKASCIFVPASSVEYLKISPRHLRWHSTLASRDPLSRPGRCTTVGAATGPNPALGGGCLTDAECGTSGVCSLTTGGPLGVYVSVTGLAASTEVQLSRCAQ